MTQLFRAPSETLLPLRSARDTGAQKCDRELASDKAYEPRARPLVRSPTNFVCGSSAMIYLMHVAAGGRRTAAQPTDPGQPAEDLHQLVGVPAQSPHLGDTVRPSRPDSRRAATVSSGNRA